MTRVAKYNVCKGVSTLLTVGTPIATLLACSDLFIQRPATAMSATGVFAVLIASLFLKDKIAENFKLPSPFIVATIMLCVIILIENILLPMKYVCITTMIATGVDELTFKRLYKQQELLLPEEAKAFKSFGYIFATNKKIETIAKEKHVEE